MKAVIFDAGNTLLFLDHDRMAAAVSAGLGLSLRGEQLAAAVPAAAQATERAGGIDRDRARTYMEALFAGAGVPSDRLAEVEAIVRRLQSERHLWCRMAPDTREALGRLRGRGLRLGVVSNSDGSVELALAAAGLREYFDVVLDSALIGVEKPDPTIFRAALDALGVAASEAVYVGDLYDVDVMGARGAGIQGVLLLSDLSGPRPDCRRFGSLTALVDDLLKGEPS